MRTAVALTLALLCSWTSLAAGSGDPARAGAPLAPAATGPVPAEFRAPEPVPLPAQPGEAAPSDPRDGRGPSGLLERRALTGAEREIAEKFVRQQKAAMDIGGDEVLVRNDLFYLDDVHLDIASNGDIYVGVERQTGSPDYDEWFEVYRSTDGGTTFVYFGGINSGGDPYERLYDIVVVEGIVDRLYAWYMYWNPARGRFDFKVAYADIPASSAIWQIRTVMNTPGVSFLGPDVDTDIYSFDDFYMYAVCAGLDGNGDDIFYSRSTDHGNSWSAPIRIAEITSSGNLMYSRPQVAYGQGGLVHVAWTYTERLQTTFDDAIRYLRGTNYGSGAGSFTASQWQLTPTTDGTDQLLNEVFTTGPELVLGISYFTWNGTSPKLFTSLDAGVSWTTGNNRDLPFVFWGDLEWDPLTNRIVGVGDMGNPDWTCALSSVPVSSLSSWNPPQQFGEQGGGYGGYPSFALDPTRGNRAGFAWTYLNSEDVYQAVFDAEWRADDGYPNYEPGFPVDVPSTGGLASFKRTPPAVANIDADPYGEIIFGDRDGNIHVLSHLGTVPGGWPRDIGEIPWGAPVAVGDLYGDGSMAIVAGNTTGQVYAFDSQANLLPGFPVDLGTGGHTFVSMGVLGGKRWIFAASGNHMARISSSGAVNFKSGTLNGWYAGPAAVGDLDGDGFAEVVVNYLSTSLFAGVHVYNGDLSGSTANRSLVGYTPNGSVSLADLDLDGDLEICFPTNQGRLFVMHHDFSDVAGFPYDNGTGSAITSVSIAQILGTSQPDLLFASHDGQVNLMLFDGDQAVGFPATIGGVRGGPIPVGLQDHSNWLVVGSGDQSIYTLRNVNAIGADGWPRTLNDVIEVSPAVADLDADGRTEIVFLGNESVHVIDVGPRPPFADHTWTMYGYDAERASCYQCDADVVTSNPLAGPTRIAFRLASRNPSPGAIAFAAELPADGVAELQVFDVRGRRVRLVTRRELQAGTHQLIFDGRDHSGRRLARGQYFARLSVRGAGFQETVTQRFALVD